jgi:hypothetical protein
VPFVETGYDCSPKNRDGGPARRPLHIGHGRQSGAPGAEKQDAQNAVADDVAALANVKVPIFKALPVQAEEEMQQRIENATSIVRRKQGTGLDGDHDKPEDRSDPRLQEVVPIGVQAGVPPPSCAQPSPQKLLDAIVGSLAGDHDVVNVALAQPGAADPHKASFLQQFSNGGAAAVAHT